MKEIKELEFNTLSPEQKIGLIFCGGTGSCRTVLRDPANFEFYLDLIRKRALGAMWVECNPRDKDIYPGMIEKIRETADYPIIIFTDEESGFGDHMIGKPISLGYVNDEKTAYAYGKAIGIDSRKAGFNCVANPLLDRTAINRPCGGVLRSIHPDKERAAKLAAAMCRGMHDAGILNCGKHYPSALGEPVDSHMAEPVSEVSKEELIGDCLYPYRYLIERGLLDSVMTGHRRLINIDAEYPASMSEKVMKILRDIGFEGVAVTDALMMMGVVARFGYDEPRYRSITAGNDMALPFVENGKDGYDSLLAAYKRGDITESRLDEAVKRVLAMQHKASVLSQQPPATLSADEEKAVRDINKKSIGVVSDAGAFPVPTDKKHLFVMLTENEVTLSETVENDTMSVPWYDVRKISARIKENFPESDILPLLQFPTANTVAKACKTELCYDDVVFVTFFEDRPYLGKECFTSRILSLIEAWQKTDRICAVVHYGNPFLLEELPHIPAIVNACKSAECTLSAIDVLAGKLSPGGEIPYKIKLR